MLYRIAANEKPRGGVAGDGLKGSDQAASAGRLDAIRYLLDGERTGCAHFSESATSHQPYVRTLLPVPPYRDARATPAVP